MTKFWIGWGLLAAGALLVGSGGGALDGIGGMKAEIIAGGKSLGKFTALSSPSIDVEVIEIHDPMVGTTKVPGKVRVGSITFEAGYAPGNALVDWQKEVVAATTPTGGPDPMLNPKRDGTIVLFNDVGQEVARYDFSGGWPSSLVGFSTARSGFQGRVVDLLELNVDRIQRIEAAPPAPAGGGQK